MIARSKQQTQAASLKVASGMIDNNFPYRTSVSAVIIESLLQPNNGFANRLPCTNGLERGNAADDSNISCPSLLSSCLLLHISSPSRFPGLVIVVLQSLRVVAASVFQPAYLDQKPPPGSPSISFFLPQTNTLLQCLSIRGARISSVRLTTMLFRNIRNTPNRRQTSGANKHLQPMYESHKRRLPTRTRDHNPST